jgi:redox-sensitive bicupin YhaK (pirin superfamily)
MSIRRAAERGGADHGWLKTSHTFSFARYHDPRFMGFGPLRVINQDRVAPGRGFGTHSHNNMEIISYVTHGTLKHKDTIGTGSEIVPGEVQLMSAGRGIAHSEMNGSDIEEVRFLQIWIMPNQQGTPPRYEQKLFPLDKGIRLVVSPDGQDGSLTVGQDMALHRVLLAEGQVAEHSVQRRRVWVQIITGTLEVSGALLFPGDGLAVVEADTLSLRADSGDVEALIFDMI